jgi:hypothetical protein
LKEVEGINVRNTPVRISENLLDVCETYSHVACTVCFEPLHCPAHITYDKLLLRAEIEAAAELDKNTAMMDHLQHPNDISS